MPEMNNLNPPEPKPAGFPPPSANTNGSATPLPPPPPEITIRTMKSDLESLRQNGGATPSPKPFTPPELKKEWLPPAPPPPPKITPSDFAAPRKADSLSITSTDKSAPIIEKEDNEQEQNRKSALKKVMLWLGVGIIAVGVGLIGYFVIFPILFPAQTPPPPPPAITAPSAAELPTGTVPLAPTATSPPQTLSTPEAPKSHQSLLRSSDATLRAILAAADLSSINNALKEESKKSLSSGTLAEITLDDTNGQLASSALLPALLPELSPETVKNLLDEDFTAALYFDNDGTWPAYIFKLSLGSSIVEAQAEVSKWESSPNLKNLFNADPGAPNGSGFKTGQVNGTATRYLTFSKKGAGLNIAWTNDKLVISTSFNGLKKILSNLSQ